MLPQSGFEHIVATGWVNYLGGGTSVAARGFGFTAVNVDLTMEGIGELSVTQEFGLAFGPHTTDIADHTEDIVTLVFQYLNMLHDEGPQEWIFKELQEQTRMAFNFKGKESPQAYVLDLAGSLHVSWQIIMLWWLNVSFACSCIPVRTCYLDLICLRISDRTSLTN